MVTEYLADYWLTGVAAFAASATVVYLVTPWVIRLAHEVGAGRHGGGRHVHEGFKPSIGGLAILAGLLVGVVAGLLVNPSSADAVDKEILAIALGGAIVMLAGFLDDLWELAPAVRLVAQVGAALVLVSGGVRIDIFGVFAADAPIALTSAASAVLTVLWVVAFTNAFNFIDGLDGLSVGIATIALWFMLVISVANPDRGAAVLLIAALAGAAVAFLRENLAPARIMLGDSGAYLIGFILASISVLSSLKVSTALAAGVPLLVLALPTMNMSHVVLQRWRSGDSPVEARNDHLHDLLRAKLGESRAVVLLWGISGVLGAVGILAAGLSIWTSLGALGTVGLILYGVQASRRPPIVLETGAPSTARDAA